MIEKKLRGYILPNVLATTVTSCYVLADTYFIALAQGANGITGLNLVLPVYAIIFSTGMMIGIGSATRYTILRSLGEEKEAEKYFSNSCIWAIILSMIFVTMGIFIPDAVLKFFGADTTIETITLPYVKIVLCFAPFFMLNYTFNAFVRNDGSPKIAMIATLSSGIFNIIFDYILMFPLGMGMTGAALATGLSPIVNMSICMAHYLSKNNNIKFKISIPSVKRLIMASSLGTVAFVGEISNGIITMVFNFLLLSLAGNIGVAAYGVVANIALVGTALLNGVSQGLQPVASETYGKGIKDDLKRIYRHSLLIGVIIAFILVTMTIIFSENIIAAFNNEKLKELTDYAMQGLRLYIIGFLPAAFNIITAGYYSATGKAKESSFIAILRGVIAIVFFAILLSRFIGIIGVWISFPVSEVFTLIACVVMVKMGDKVNNAV